MVPTIYLTISSPNISISHTELFISFETPTKREIFEGIKHDRCILEPYVYDHKYMIIQYPNDTYVSLYISLML